MKKSNLVLQLKVVEGALQRMLSTIERRGFRVLSCTASTRKDAYSVKLEVEGARDPGLLCRQLDRLFDVREARLSS